MTEKTKKNSFIEGLKNPNSYVIILSLILVCMILTWIVPSGSYERVQDPASGRTVIDPQSFHYVEDKSVNIFGMLKAIPKAFLLPAVLLPLFSLFQERLSLSEAQVQWMQLLFTWFKR